MAIIWGEPIWGNYGCGIRLGYEVSSANNKTEVVTTMKVYFQTWLFPKLKKRLLL